LNDEKFEYVIFGTGLTESIIGASLAMHGKKCLFLDKADKYGGTVCNFSLEQYLNFIKKNVDNPANSEEGDAAAAFHSFKVLQPLDKTAHPEIMTDDNGFKRYSRSFNIDVAPKILFSKSISVDNLIRCQVSSYLEFNNVAENFFYNPKSEADTNKASLDKSMVKIPFSKSEIFTNTVLTF